MKKRILSLLLVVAMAFCMLSTSSTFVFATTTESVDTVEQIIILNVYEPVAGEYPRYTQDILGSGYQVDTNKNVYYDDWQNNKKLYYIKNGIGWFDLTEFDWVYEHEMFLPGHEYQLNVYLKTEDGYEFAHNEYYEPQVVATVNSNIADTVITGSNCAVEQHVRYSFGVCQSVDVVLAMINSIDKPKAGNTPDFEIIAAHSSFYVPDPNFGTNGIIWYDSEGTVLSENDTFVEGEQYRIEIKIIPVQVDGINMCEFINPFEAYINGVKVDENDVWAMSDRAYIYYTFESTAPAPETPTRKGDVNGDGGITSTDYILAKRAVMETYTLSETQIDVCDINGDGVVTATDYIFLKRAVMGTYTIQ